MITPLDPSGAATTTWQLAKSDMSRALHGHLPARYEHWVEDYLAHFLPDIEPGWQILDVGAGRHPTIPVERRITGSTYVGQDLSQAELGAACPGAYDEVFVGNVLEPIDAFRERFDLVLSYQVLEHVRPLEQALENLRCYLRPGGRLVIQFSGAFSYFALASRLIPSKVTTALLTSLTRRDSDTIFPAYYDHCWATALQQLLTRWTSVTISPLWGGSSYLQFAPLLAALNIGYETWAMAGHHTNLATHYIVDAVR